MYSNNLVLKQLMNAAYLQILRNLTTKANLKSCRANRNQQIFRINCENIIEQSEINKLNYLKLFDLYQLLPDYK